MDEVRRFLRFTLPGIACAIQLIIALSISDADKVHAFLEVTGFKDSVALVLTAFLASGGLGYIFAIVYFALYWLKPLASFTAIDHCIPLKRLEQYIEIRELSETEIPSETGDSSKRLIAISSLSKRQAWLIATRYWLCNSEQIDRIKSINPTIDRLVDVTHAMGATIVGSVLTIIAWICIHFIAFEKPFRFWSLSLGSVIWLALLALMLESYSKTREARQSMFNSTLTETILEAYGPEGPKVKIWYSE